MGFDDFFVHEKRDDVEALIKRAEPALSDTRILQLNETVERYCRDGWRMRTIYEFSTWIGAIAYEAERDAKVLNIGFQWANYAPHRSVTMPGLVLFSQLMHDQKHRANGNIPPEFVHFELWKAAEAEGLQRLYPTLTLRDGPVPYLRVGRVPFEDIGIL